MKNYIYAKLYSLHIYYNVVKNPVEQFFDEDVANISIRIY